MKFSQTFHMRLLVAAAVLFLISCSQDDLDKLKTKFSSQTQETQKPPASLHELTAPNPASMDAEVAVVVEASWNDLLDILATTALTPKSRATAYANYGLVAFGNGLSLPAEAAFENATRLMPKDARWIYFLALIHEYNGSLDKAARGLQNVLAIQGENLPALLRLGDVLFEQAEMLRAKTRFQEALKIDQKSAAALYGLGRVANAQGQYLDAISYFEKALEQQPQADRINYFLGTAWRNLGEREKATIFLGKHGSNEPSFSDPLFDEISGGEARIDGLWAHMNAGSQALIDGNYGVAIDEFQLATQDLPDDPRSWQSLGMAFNKALNPSAAINAYNRALELSQDNAVIHHELAKLLMSASAMEQAEIHLIRAIKIDPRMLDAYSTLAQLLAKTNRMGAALKNYEKAQSLDPQSGELAISRAETLIALDRADQAKTVLDEATRINPRDANVRMAYGLVLADVNQLDQAMIEVERALADASEEETRSQAYYAIGQVHLKLGNGLSAIDSFGSALRINSRNRPAGLELARTFIRVQDLEQALGTYQVFLKNWPEHDGARVEAARVAVMRGNGTKAKEFLEAGASRESASARLLGSLARLLVLSTEQHIRNPKLALKHAQRALEKNQGQQHRETMALCQAALGDFGQAVELQKRLLKNVASNTSLRTRTRMEKNLERYQAKGLGRLPFDAS